MKIDDEQRRILNKIERYATPKDDVRRWARGAIRQGLSASRVWHQFLREVRSGELT